MSALLLSWLRSTAQLPRSVECLERDLSNGYLLGHILSSLELEAAPESYADSANLASVLLNFERLEKSLHGVGIRLAPDTARNIMMEKKGAVAKLLMQLKEHVDRKEASRPKRIEPATASLRPPPDDSHRHMPAPDMTSPRDRFVENIIASIDPSDWNNHNRVDMAIHLRKFTEFMWSASDATAAHFASEHDHKLAAARRARDDELTHTHEKQAFLEQWSAMGRDKWAANQALLRAPIAASFSQHLRERRRVIIAHANEAAAIDLADGVSSFDKNFKRLGISSGDDDTGVRLTPAKGSGLDHLVELETRVESFHLRPSSNIQMMKELRDRRKLHLNAQRERASRRRKMLVDQTRNTIEINRKQEEAALLHRLFIVGKRRRSVLQTLWEVRHGHEKTKNEANVAATERVIAYAAMIEAAAATSLGELHVAAMAPDAVARRAETLRAAVDEARVHDERKLEAHTLLCSDVLDTLLSFVHTVVVHRASTRQPMPAPLYRSLKAQFVSGAIRGPSMDTTPSERSGCSSIEVDYLVRDYVGNDGVFGTPDMGDPPTTTDVDMIQATIHALATTPPSELLMTSWPPLSAAMSRPLLLCWYAKDSSSSVATALAANTGLQLWTIDACVDRCVKLSERGKPAAGEKPSPLEMEMAALGTKMAQARAKGGAIPDAVVSDMVCKALVHVFTQADAATFIGVILLNYPRSKEEAKVFEVEMLKRFHGLSDTELALRSTQLVASWDEKAVVTEGAPLSSIDWALFLDASTDALVADVGTDAAKKDVLARAETWTTTTAALTAFWKPLGCAFTLNTTTTPALALDETLQALLRLAPDAHHILLATDPDRFVSALTAMKNDRRRTMTHPELLVVRDRCGEHSLPWESLRDLDDAVNYHDVEQCQVDRVQALQAFYESLQSFSRPFLRLRNQFLAVLDANTSQQTVIDAALQDLARTFASPKERHKHVRRRVMALEVDLGDLVDAVRGPANAFLQSPETWHLSVDVFLKSVVTWATALLRTEKKQLLRRLRHLTSYFELVDPIAAVSATENDSGMHVALDALQALPPTTALRDAVHEIVGDVFSSASSDGSSLQSYVLNTERALFLRRCIGVVRFANNVARRVAGAVDAEKTSLDTALVEFVHQEFRHIAHVIEALRAIRDASTPAKVCWPRLQSLTTPLDGHGVHMAHHKCFLSVPHLRWIVRALQAATNNSQGQPLSVSAFTASVVQVATAQLLPPVWTSYPAVANMAVAFATADAVDWRRLLLSLAMAQKLPVPDVRDLETLCGHWRTRRTLDAVVDKAAFLSAPLWCHDSAIQHLLHELFADAVTGDVAVVPFLLHMCASSYPLDVLPPCHASLARFSRGVAKATYVLDHWPPMNENAADDVVSVPALLYAFAGVPVPESDDPSVALVDEHALQSKFALLNPYVYLVEHEDALS